MKPTLAALMKPDESEDQRAFKRYPVSLSILVQPATDEGASPSAARRTVMAAAVVTEVSLSGVVFLSPRPYPSGSLVELQMSLGAHVYLVRAVVRRSQVCALPGRRSFQCAVQFARGESVAHFIPAIARYLHRRYDAPAKAGPPHVP